MSTRLYVGNLSSTTSAADLERAFAPWGGCSVSIPVDDMRRPRPFGFLDVADDQMVTAIAAMHGQELGGRVLAVCEARWPANNGGYGPTRGGWYTGGRGGYGEGGAGGGGRW